MSILLSPIPFVRGNRNTRILGDIRPRERHEILVVHLKRLDNIFYSKSVGILIAHIVKNSHKSIRITPQLVFINTALHSINSQRHNAVEPVSHVDLRFYLPQPPIIQITLHSPPTAPFAANHTPFIPIRILLFGFLDGQRAFLQNPGHTLQIAIRVRNILKQILKRH